MAEQKPYDPTRSKRIREALALLAENRKLGISRKDRGIEGQRGNGVER